MSSNHDFIGNQLRLIRAANTRLLTRINELELTIEHQSTRISILETPSPVASSTTAPTTKDANDQTTDQSRASPLNVPPPPSTPAKRQKCSDTRIFGLTVIDDDNSTVPATVLTDSVRPKAKI